jgi:hypothetical protein
MISGIELRSVNCVPYGSGNYWLVFTLPGVMIIQSPRLHRTNGPAESDIYWFYYRQGPWQ